MRYIRLLVGVSGKSFSWRPGQEVLLPDEEAEKWADGRRAVFVEDEEPETDPPEPSPEHTPEPARKRKRPRQRKKR